MKTAITGQNWKSIGSAIINGIKNGISGAVRGLVSRAVSAALSAYNAAKRALGISSPSRLAALEIGQPFVEGIALGIEQAQDALRNRLASVLTGTAYDVDAGRFGSRVLRPQSWRSAGSPRNAGGGGVTYYTPIHVAGSILAEEELKKLVYKLNERAPRTGRSFTGGSAAFAS